MMQDKHDLISQHNFTYRLPKVILDKFQEIADKKGGGKGDKKKTRFWVKMRVNKITTKSSR